MFGWGVPFDGTYCGIDFGYISKASPRFSDSEEPGVIAISTNTPIAVALCNQDYLNVQVDT